MSTRRGRPPNPPVEGLRHSLGLKVTAETKRRLDQAARASGRTQSQEAERLIDLALRVEMTSKVLAVLKPFAEIYPSTVTDFRHLSAARELFFELGGQL